MQREKKFYIIYAIGRPLKDGDNIVKDADGKCKWAFILPTTIPGAYRRDGKDHTSNMISIRVKEDAKTTGITSPSGRVVEINNPMVGDYATNFFEDNRDIYPLIVKQIQAYLAAKEQAEKDAIATVHDIVEGDHISLELQKVMLQGAFCDEPLNKPGEPEIEVHLMESLNGKLVKMERKRKGRDGKPEKFFPTTKSFRCFLLGNQCDEGSCEAALQRERDRVLNRAERVKPIPTGPAGSSSAADNTLVVDEGEGTSGEGAPAANEKLGG